MASKAGVGFSEDRSSKTAGRKASRRAQEQLNGAQADLVFVFATVKHEPKFVIEGIRDVLGESPRMLGGSAGGVLTNDSLGYEGYQVGVAALSFEDVTADLSLEPELVDQEYEAGRRLAERMINSESSPFLFLYDSVKKTRRNGGPELNLATPLIEGMAQAVDDWPPVAGGGLVADALFVDPAYQLIDGRIERESVLGLTLSGDVQMDTLILHGCRPASPYHTITETDGNAVLEIDGQPALTRIDQMLGPDPHMDREDYPLYLTLGLNKGQKFGPFKEENYANRLCFDVDENREALLMFEPDLQAGDEVQLMRRDLNLDYIGERTDAFFEQLDGRVPFFALYIDCIGRAAAYNGMDSEEAAEVQKQLGDLPLLGFYSGVEIATCGSEVQALDWTGVLCVFSADEAP